MCKTGDLSPLSFPRAFSFPSPPQVVSLALSPAPTARELAVQIVVNGVERTSQVPDPQPFTPHRSLLTPLLPRGPSPQSLPGPGQHHNLTTPNQPPPHEPRTPPGAHCLGGGNGLDGGRYSKEWLEKWYSCEHATPATPMTIAPQSLPGPGPFPSRALPAKKGAMISMGVAKKNSFGN